VVDTVMAHRPATVVDGYSGSGDVAVALAARGVKVIAIELDSEASAWASSRLPAGSRAVTARVEDAIRNTLPADVVILNPPRTGVDARVTAALSKAIPAPRAIVYVSCDPATLARDLSRLPGWTIVKVTAFDMFPQTAHVETVCELVPASPVAA
jgi:23S rRNA (uracil1939-C5)-methyltransferase